MSSDNKKYRSEICLSISSIKSVIIIGLSICELSTYWTLANWNRVFDNIDYIEAIIFLLYFYSRLISGKFLLRATTSIRLLNAPKLVAALSKKLFVRKILSDISSTSRISLNFVWELESNLSREFRLLSLSQTTTSLRFAQLLSIAIW